MVTRAKASTAHARRRRSTEPLSVYRAKRDFVRTPEPSGEKTPAPQAGRLRFVVQKHRASHLHYDFRLEAGGVLASWAVPKGPTLNPHEKRLAMHVEDHPLAYRDFEGIIPEGGYGAGEVIVWDRGTYEPVGDVDAAEAIRKGKIKFRLFGKKLSGVFTLVQMHGARNADGKAWLLLKEDDDAADEAWSAEEHVASVKSGKTLADIAASPRAKRWISNRAAASAPPAKTAKTVKTAKTAKTPPEATATRTAKTPKAAAKTPRAKTPRRRDPIVHVTRPMLTTLVDAPFDDDAWLFEVKWDGIRAIVTVDERGRVSAVSRNGLDLLRSFPELAEIGGAFTGTPVVVDGEIVALDAEGKSSFQRLQRRTNRAAPTGKEIGATPLTFVVFDALYAEGRDLRALPLEERKEILARNVKQSDEVLYSQHVVGRGTALFEAARAKGLEGIVAKRRDAPYVAKRTRDWLKIKCQQTQETVVVGWTDPRGARTGFGSLLLAVHDPDAAGPLTYVGHVGTGFDGATLTSLKKRLDALATPKPPLPSPPRVRAGTVHWVRPEIVAQVKFSEWTADGIMRHPSFEGLRIDKGPAECVREDPRKLAAPKERGAPPKRKRAERTHQAEGRP